MMQRFNWYCLCGARWNGTQQNRVVTHLRKQWELAHAAGTVDGYGDKHGATDRNTCNRAHAKKEN